MNRKSPDLATIFRNAVDRHSAGDLDTAETGYRKILQSDPAHVDALHMLGMAAYQRGKYNTAIKLINRAVQYRSSCAVIYTNLGAVYNANKQPDAAISVLKKAMTIDPSMALAYNNLGNAYHTKGLDGDSVSSYKMAISINPSFADAHANLGSVFYKKEQFDEAEKCFRKVLEINPEHSSAKHVLASLSGYTTSSAPLDHVSRLFDEYSARFDEHLVHELGYSMPKLIRSEIDRITRTGAMFNNVIDLGCGTGLAGVELRPVSKRLTGIDISLRMVEKARARNIYDLLHDGDLLAWLDGSSEKYDLFICADVFPYIGDITPLFSSIKKCAMDNAYFVFSTESTSDDDYILRKTGRYAHSSKYIERTAKDIGFSVLTLETKNLRKQKGKWIKGDLVALVNESIE